jgi:hypothetical protein
LPAFGGWAGGDAYPTQLAEDALGGAFVGVEAALEALEAVFEVFEGGAEGVFPAADVDAVVRLVIEVVVLCKVVFPEVSFDGAEAAYLPLVVDEGIDEVALARADGVKLGVILGGEAGEGFGVFAADDVGFGMKAGLEGVKAGDGFAGLGARAGRMLRIQAIRADLSFGCHKRSPRAGHSRPLRG